MLYHLATSASNVNLFDDDYKVECEKNLWVFGFLFEKRFDRFLFYTRIICETGDITLD